MEALLTIGSIIGNVVSSVGSFASWMKTFFGTKRPGDISAKQMLKAMKDQQQLMVATIAVSMTVVLLTQYYYES